MKSTSLSPAFVRNTLATALLAIGSVCASNAMALTIAETENNDPTGSGVSLSFANFDAIASGSHTITGTTNPLQDVDLFKFDVSAGLFMADLVSMTQTSVDGYQAHMYLFDSNKVAVDFDFDPSDMNGTMGIKIQSMLTAGTYYLAVGGLNNHPINGGGDFVYFSGGAVDHWNGLGAGTGTYAINVTSVPEADTYAMLLAGLGLVGFMARRRPSNLV